MSADSPVYASVEAAVASLRRQADDAKDRALDARLRAAQASDDVDLRVQSQKAERAAREAGRRLAEAEFEAEVDQLVGDILCDRITPDERVVKLAPRSASGDIDAEWIAAVHLRRSGVATPRDWRSPMGNHINVREPDAAARAVRGADDPTS